MRDMTNNLNDFVTGVIRTWVPIGVGTAATWLSLRLGFIIDEQSQAGFVASLTATTIGAYYAIVRRLEERFPQIGWLLGLARTPKYRKG